MNVSLAMQVNQPNTSNKSSTISFAREYELADADVERATLEAVNRQPTEPDSSTGEMRRIASRIRSSSGTHTGEGRKRMMLGCVSVLRKVALKICFADAHK